MGQSGKGLESRGWEGSFLAMQYGLRAALRDSCGVYSLHLKINSPLHRNRIGASNLSARSQIAEQLA